MSGGILAGRWLAFVFCCGAMIVSTWVEGRLAVAADEPVPAAESTGNPAELFRQAYEISTRSATRTEADYRRMIELCLEGLSAAPDERNAAYGRQLGVWAYERWGNLVAGRRGPDALADAAAMIHAGDALFGSGLTEAEHGVVAPRLSAALTVRGESRFDDNQLEAAGKDFERACELDPKNWQALQNRGVLRAINGQYDEALADFGRVLRLNPRYANAWFNRGEIYYQRGEYDQAIECYNNALQLNANDAVTLVSRGHAWYRKRDYRRAVADFNQALQRDPSNAVALTHRAIAYCDLSAYRQAADDFRAAFRIDPEFGQAYLGAGWMMATAAEDDYYRPDEALRAAEKAIELDGASNYRYLDVLAAALAANGRFEEAVAKQKEALEMAEGQSELVLKELQDRLDLFEQQQPFREAGR